jgi:hypothetical protein
VFRLVTIEGSATVVVDGQGLRRTFCITGLLAGISIRDLQYAMRDADPRTAMRYDMAKANLERPPPTPPPTPSPPTSPA